MAYDPYYRVNGWKKRCDTEGHHLRRREIAQREPVEEKGDPGI
jgi:hypothetical protein